MTKSYRQNVCGLLIYDNKILLCERADYPGSWQFPQGGIEASESVEDAFYREMHEELNITKDLFLDIKINKNRYRYDFLVPKENCIGQEQSFVRANLREKPVITLNHEFSSYVWVNSHDIYQYHFVHFKKDAAFSALRDFKILKK